MNRFLARFGSEITGVLSGFDRLVFRGHLIALIRPGGIHAFLRRAGVRLLDFKDYVSSTSERVKAAALADARESDRPIRYLPSSRTDKEDLVRRLLAEQPVDHGLVCALTSLEPCMSFEYHRSQDPDARGLKLRPRKCLHVYKYYIDPVFGLIGTRLQTWFPFDMQIWLNGREWLAVELSKAAIRFKRNDNCFTWIADPNAAQQLMTTQLETDWATTLATLARAINPIHESVFEPSPQQYYWSVYQSEWATDLMFTNPRALAGIYPTLTTHAMLHFASPDVMRFLGRKAHGNFTGELVTRFKDRAEGVRVKHWVDGNSLKMYDKAASVLRVETTVAKTTPFKAFRAPQNRPAEQPAWKPMRKGVADLHRRAEVSQAANERYLDALSTVDDSTPLASLFDQVARPVSYHGRTARPIRIGDPTDVALLEAISRGEFATAGFRNRDLRCLLFPSAASSEHAKKRSAKVSRLFRLLRAHGLIRKLPRTHRYTVTPKGHTLAAALFAARQATTKQILAFAA